MLTHARECADCRGFCLRRAGVSPQVAKNLALRAYTGRRPALFARRQLSFDLFKQPESISDGVGRESRWVIESSEIGPKVRTAEMTTTVRGLRGVVAGSEKALDNGGNELGFEVDFHMKARF